MQVASEKDEEGSGLEPRPSVLICVTAKQKNNANLWIKC